MEGAMGRKQLKPPKVLYVGNQETPHPREHNYHAKLMPLMEAMLAQGVPPGVSSIRVAHDDWCGIYQGKRCNCDPEVSLEWTLEAQGQS
jgi:hypothetical protein